jgi:beta-galactosidase
MMIRGCLLLPVILFSLNIPAGAPAAEIALDAARRVSFDADWRFLNADAPGAEQPGFDDGGWRRLDLPHDWAIEGPFDPKYSPENGALPFFGTGWYRKHFTVTASARERYVSIEFDGAMANSRVWLNGRELGGRPYGYIGFSFDLTPYLRFDGQDNVLAVRLTPQDESSRWYPGAGIYRHVWLDVTGPVHVARWGTYVTTPHVSDDKATVSVAVTVRNRTDAPVSITVDTSIVDTVSGGLAGSVTPLTIPKDDRSTLNQTITLLTPRRWEIDRPYLYRAVTVIRDGDRVLDRYETPFGVRVIQFDNVNGFRLNGRHVPIQGVCLHHDLGAFGAAVNRRATERQIEIMKRMGANAIRTSHNPPSPELLDAADRLGMLVLDEAFDEWRTTKVKNGHGTYFDEWGEGDLADMIRRDRNHPSVIMWSIGNEVPDQGTPDGVNIARRLTAVCHREDPTRPVTSGFNQIDDAIKNGLTDAVDVVGFNYGARRYEAIIKAHPHWIVLATETSSAVSSRGVYHLPIEKYQKHASHQLSSYDIIAPPWAYAPDVEWDALDRSPSVLGEFVWTGFDYLGEPTPYFLSGADKKADWPARSSYFGIVDLAGIPKDRFYLYQSRWSRAPMVHVLPHWNWAGREGQPIPVFVYTNADEVELFLNGQSLGVKKKGAEPVEIPMDGRNVKPGTFATRYRLAWNVPWQPGTLRATAKTGGQVVASDEVKTSGAPAKIALVPDRSRIAADGDDLSFLTVRVEDKDGNLCPLADNLVRFTVSGAGRIAAVDNGNAATVEPFQANERKAFSGMAMLIVRSNGEAAGEILVKAESPGLAPASVTLTTARK